MVSQFLRSDSVSKNNFSLKFYLYYLYSSYLNPKQKCLFYFVTFFKTCFNDVKLFPRI